MDEYTDVFDDADQPEDTASGDDHYGPVEDLSGDGGGDPDFEDSIEDDDVDVADDDEDDSEDSEVSGLETDGDFEEDPDPEHEEETEIGGSSDDAEGVDGISFDPEILSEIDDTLHRHADDVSGFVSGLTVSGNAVIVSLDGGSAALLRETIDNQNEVIGRIDYMSGVIVLVLFVLLFDLIHRFAKRIIKNFMRGDEKNAAGS